MPQTLVIGVVEKFDLDNLTNQDFENPDFSLTEMSEHNVEVSGDFIDFFIPFMSKFDIKNQPEIKTILKKVGDDDFPTPPKLISFKEKYPNTFRFRSQIAILDEDASKLVGTAISVICSKGYEGIVSAFLDNKYVITAHVVYTAKDKNSLVSGLMVFDPENRVVLSSGKYVDNKKSIPIISCENYSEYYKLCLYASDDGKKVFKINITDKKGKQAPNRIYSKVTSDFEDSRYFSDMLALISMVDWIKNSKNPILWFAET
ncbi:hypothetical protein KO465_09495 [Candidatus Micrarchaeota archaeon]|jgi:hypothetical protein|nr:hypothetical protein [Candidatus Micrarchaeota archaeon]